MAGKKIPRGNTSHAKMIRLSSGKFWSIVVQIGGGRDHRRQVVIFDTQLNTCVCNQKNRNRLKSVVLIRRQSYGCVRQTKFDCNFFIFFVLWCLPHLFGVLLSPSCIHCPELRRVLPALINDYYYPVHIMTFSSHSRSDICPSLSTSDVSQ